MPGTTGKRARAPKPCYRCGGKIEGEFLREREGDRHIQCAPGIIRQIVDRCHVGQSNRSVIKYFVSRLRKGAWKLMPREDRKKYLRWVIQAHAENRSLYRMVMGGSR
jgi:hypothetical protein